MAVEDESVAASVKVAVRLRPMSEREMRGNTIPVVNGSSERNEVMLIKGAGSHQQRKTYSFDAVYTSFSTQSEVFQTVEPLVSDVLSGYEATVFAYGQTGTGKTHTMEGDISSDEQKGVIPRAVEAIFDRLRDNMYTESSVSASYLEIYNEELSDLLAETAPDLHGQKTAFGQPTLGKTPAALMLVEDIGTKKAPGKGVFVKNLSEHEVKSTSDVLSLIQLAQERRRVGETKMNKHSSRSHCVFTLTVSSKRPTSDGSIMECSGKLNLVDLAGSECAKSAVGENEKNSDRDRERKNINTSLLVLGRVISMLRNSEVKKSTERIPYRDSKLTRLLQESLGGRCKTLLIATLSPSVLAVEETHSTLNYAQSALGVVNRAVATSYIRMSNPKEMGAYTARETTGEAGGAHVQDWHEMECRIAYMQSQLDEAQAALARKHSQQEAIIKRAEEAEIAHAAAEARAEVSELECGRLGEQLQHCARELEVTKFFVSERSRTEERLSYQARQVINCLQQTESEATMLHDCLINAAGQAEELAKLRDEFTGNSKESLVHVCAEIDGLSSVLSQQRAAALQALHKSQQTRERHTEKMNQLANMLARDGEEEVKRALVALHDVCAETTTTLGESSDTVQQHLTSLVAAATAAQMGVAAKIASLSDLVKKGEEELFGWVQEADARHAAAAEDQTAVHSKLRASFKLDADGAVSRLQVEQARLREHTDELQKLLAEVVATQEAEKKLQGLHDVIKAEHEAERSRASARFAELLKAIAEASKAQQQEQRDGQVCREIESSAAELESMYKNTTGTLREQGEALTIAIQEQRRGNKTSEVSEQARDVQRAVDDSAAARNAEMVAARAALSSQKHGLEQLLADQAEQRTQLRASVLAALTSHLDAELDRLSVSVNRSVASAIELATGVSNSCQDTANREEATRCEKESMTAALIQTVTEWGKSNDAVVCDIERAVDAKVAAENALQDGKLSMEKSQARAKAEVQEWASADDLCRLQLQEAVTAGEGFEQEAVTAGKAQKERIAQAAQLSVSLSESTAAQRVQVNNSAVCSEQCRVKLADVQTEVESAVARHLVEDEEIEARVQRHLVDERRALAGLPPKHSNAAAREQEILDAARVSGSDLIGALEVAVREVVEMSKTAAASQLARWEKFSADEARAGETATTSLRRVLAEAEVEVKADRDATAAAIAKADEEVANDGELVCLAIMEQTSALQDLAERVEAFSTASRGIPHPAAPERSRWPYTEALATTASDEAMLRHFETAGSTPMPRESTPNSPPPPTHPPKTLSGMLCPAAKENAENAGDLANGNLPAVALNLHMMKVTDLRRLCEENELQSSGFKSELIGRLQSAFASKGPRTPQRPRSDPGVLAAAAENYSSGRKSAGTRLPKAGPRKVAGGHPLKEIAA